MTFTVSGDHAHTYVSDESGRIVATCDHIDDAERIAAALSSDLIANAVWQFNEAVSLLRQARTHLHGGVGAVEISLLAEEIDEGLPAIQSALEALAHEVSRG